MADVYGQGAVAGSEGGGSKFMDSVEGQDEDFVMDTGVLWKPLER